MPWVFNPFTGKLDQTAAAGGGSQVNSDWNSTSGVSQILNKPTIPAAQVNSDWNATSGVSQILNKPSLSAVATSGSVSDLSTGTLDDARLSSNVSLDNQNNNFTVGQTITAAANTSALTASYSVTGANTTPLLDLSGTWNTTGSARGILLNVTDTASAAGSLLADLQVGGTSRFSVTKAGVVTATAQIAATSSFDMGSNRGISTNGSNVFIVNAGSTPLAATTNGININSSLGFAGGNTGNTASDIFLARDAANTLALRRTGANPQAFRLYNTFTDASNFEMGFLRWNSNVLEIGTTAGGTGNATRSINLLAGGNIEFTCGGVFAASFRAARSIITTPLNFAATSLASDPTTGDLASGRAGVYKNTTSGAVRLWYNDGGTLRSVQLT